MNKYHLQIEGGLGAQIFGYIVYRYLISQGIDVILDLTYFTQKERVAKAGEGGVSIFSWKLGHYDIPLSALESHPIERSTGFLPRGGRRTVLRDGEKTKDKILQQALIAGGYRSLFKIPSSYKMSAQQLLTSKKINICVHMRRGDYLNVASHVIPSESFIYISKLLCKITSPNLYILSDSNLEEQTRCSFESLGAKILVDRDLYLSHALMRESQILVCSNSQFSISAACLSSSQLSLIPNVHPLRMRLEGESPPIFTEWTVMKRPGGQ